MWEINCSTGEVNEAEYKNERIVFIPDRDLMTGAIIGTIPETVRDIDSKCNCIYIGALNKNSAKKKFLKHLMKNATI